MRSRGFRISKPRMRIREHAGGVPFLWPQSERPRQIQRRLDVHRGVAGVGAR